MCRFVVYIGPEVLLSRVVVDPDHGMLQQALHAHDKLTPLNADGFGVAWYAHSVSPIPACFRDVSPAWSNQNLKQITRVTKSCCIFAHVRAASMGNVMQTNCHPFIFKNLSFMHNGTVPHYKFIKRKMLQSVSEAAFNLIQGTTDSEMVFAMFVTHFGRICGEESDKEDEAYSSQDHTKHLAEAMRCTLRQVHTLVLEHEKKIGTAPDTKTGPEPDGADVVPTTALPYTKAVGRLNLAVTDGRSAITARYVCSDPSTAHTLYYTRGANIEYKGRKCCVAKCPISQQRMVIVSSEPLGASYECEVVPVNHMVVIGPDDFFNVDPVHQ